MRNWSEVKEVVSIIAKGGNSAEATLSKELVEAIAEIEQLLQEKAGLVDALTILDALMDFGEELEPGGYYCYTDTVAVNRARKTAHQLLSKLEGGEPNAKP